MFPTKRYYGIFFFTILFTTLLFAKERNWSKYENQKSPYEVYLEVHNDDNRRTEVINQMWNEGSIQWENSSRSTYQYAYYGNYNGLQYYYYYYYSDGWVGAYYYYYYYDTNGNLTGYDYYGYYNGAWEHWGTGEYSNHNAYGDWGTETYTNFNSRSGKESSKSERYFNSDGNVTDIYNSYLNGNSYTNLSWTNTTWYNGYYDKKTYYDWDYANSNWVYAWMYYYYYNYGYNSQVGQAYEWLYGGSPSSWSGYKWSNGAWSPYDHRMYGYQDGYTTHATYYNSYDTATQSWYNAYMMAYYYYYMYAYVGKVGDNLDISTDRLRYVEFAEPGANEGEWIKTERTWMSYEDNTVSTENESVLPSNLNLEQNFPNPFNPETTINFTLAEASYVKLSVYDMSGRLINELINIEMNIGKHSVDWNGTDNNGYKVGAGLYLYSIETNDGIITKKMILMK